MVADRKDIQSVKNQIGASEVTTLWRYTNLFIIIIIMEVLFENR